MIAAVYPHWQALEKMNGSCSPNAKGTCMRDDCDRGSRRDVHHYNDNFVFVYVYVLVLSDSAFFTITIVAEALLTIVDSFTIVCFPVINLLNLLVGLCNSVFSLYCSIFMEVVSL